MIPGTAALKVREPQAVISTRERQIEIIGLQLPAPPEFARPDWIKRFANVEQVGYWGMKWSPGDAGVALMRIKSCEQAERSRRPLFRRYLTANGG